MYSLLYIYHRIQVFLILFQVLVDAWRGINGGSLISKTHMFHLPRKVCSGFYDKLEDFKDLSRLKPSR
jgi:hypothetical protein